MRRGGGLLSRFEDHFCIPEIRECLFGQVEIPPDEIFVPNDIRHYKERTQKDIGALFAQDLRLSVGKIGIEFSRLRLIGQICQAAHHKTVAYGIEKDGRRFQSFQLLEKIRILFARRSLVAFIDNPSNRARSPPG
jgi:hypothetical protein